MKKISLLLILLICLSLTYTHVSAAEEINIIGLEKFDNKEFPIKTDLSKMNFTEGLEIYNVDGNTINISQLLVDYSKVNINKHGTYSIDYYFMDVNQNKQILKTIQIKMIDSKAPSIHVNNLFLNINQQVDLRNFATVTDDSGLIANMDYVTNLDVTHEGDYFVKYIASDFGGNTTIAEAKIRVSSFISGDTEAPVFNNVKETITITKGLDEEKAMSLYKSGVQAFDGENDLTSQIKIITSSVDKTNPGEYKIIYYVNDAALNITVKESTVIVVDEDVEPPIIKGPSEIVVTINTTPNFRNFVTAYDEICGDLTETIEFQNNVDMSHFGEYYITFESKDLSGNKVQKSIKVIVKDNVKPSIIVPKTLQLNLGSTVDLNNYIKVTDNYDQEVEYNIDASKLDLNNVGTYLVSVQAVDDEGNTAYEMFFVDVYNGNGPEELYEDPIILGSLVAVVVSFFVLLISSMFSRRKGKRFR